MTSQQFLDVMRPNREKDGDLFAREAALGQARRDFGWQISLK